ncbi:hypothetical protein CLOP_g25639 [Closterium sp. NIES-67]|nr:hypothetical protein CLOP_g25639 [Closterium sp. NIES-67]
MAPLSRSLFSLLSFRSFRSFPAALLLSLLAFLALIALPRASRAADIVPPFPDGCVAAIADSDLAATRAVYAALPKGVFFWHDGMSKPGFFDADRNVSYCCIDQASGSGSGSSPPGVVAPPSESSPPPRCDLACPIQCTPDGRITSIISDPSLEDMPGGPGRGGSCPLGALSPAIGDLSELSSLVFRHSCLAGELPDSVTRLQKLTVLDMRDNSFSGSIPPGLFRLPALRHLHLSANGGGLSGSLPEGPGAYSTSLETVDLAGNALSGELPRTLFRAPALRWADLQSNNLTGELPGQAEAGGAGAYSASLVALILRNNSLSGGLPTELAEMTRLKMLDLGGNRLSGAVPQALGALLPAVLDVVRLDGNALTGPLCHALLPARDLALGFNPHLGGDSGEGGKGSLHGCVLPAKLEELSAPHAGLWGSVPPDLFLAVDPQTGRRPAMGGLGKVIELNFSRNSLSGSLSAFSVLPSGTLDLSYNNFTGGIPEAFFSFDRRVDVRFNALSGPLYDARRRKFEDRRFEKGTDVWDYLRVSNNSAAIARAVGAGYLPAPSPGVQASAAETAVLLAVRDALLGGPAEAAEGVDGGALADGGNSSWAALLSGWGVGTSSACAWYGVGCTADGHVDTLHLLGDETVTLHAPFVPDSPECEDVYGEKICAHDPPPPPPPVRFFLQGLPGRKSTGSLSTALGQLTRLTSLRISHHTLSSSLPASLSLLSHLVSLDLSSNRLLSGAVPPTLYTLPELRELTLRGNNLTGDALPSSGAAALSPSLESLDVGGDQLSGSIGSSIGALTSLTRLALDHNRLQGSLPGQLCALWMLRDLQLQGNALQGDLSALAAATSGSSSRMWGLGGVFPLLTLLDVSSNQLSGDAAVLAPIGSQFSYLNASHNHLTCSPGSALWTAWHVDLSHNRISAALDDLVSFPDSFAYVLRLAHNQISGPIPASLLRHTVSEELDLSHNLLSGTIPQIVNYYSMTTLDLSYNQLSGAIPDIDGSLRRCDFSHNQLTGGSPRCRLRWSTSTRAGIS